jgi:hypothetical protein
VTYLQKTPQPGDGAADLGPLPRGSYGSSTVPAAERRSSDTHGGALSRAFGLPLCLTFPIAGLPPAPQREDGSALTIVRSSEAALAERWHDDEAEPVYGRRFVGGALAMLIRRHPAAGFRIWAAGHGTYLLAPGLTRLECAAPPGTEPWRCERFLLGQVLPLAAVLRGLEVLHASAVALEGGVVAFVGAVGAGKSSIALQLMLRSGRFFCDDVLALELDDDQGVRAHPGPAIANLRPPEVELLRTTGALGEFQVVGRDDDGLRVTVPREERPLRLDRVYFLDRRWTGSDVSIEEANDPQLLIGATFNLSIRSSERLGRQLEYAGRVAACARRFRLRIPAGVGAAEVAERIEAHVRA